MSKIFRFVFLGLLLFAVLYFFGDFRINDVNIKHYLQQNVTIDNMMKTKANAIKVYNVFKKSIAMFNDGVEKIEAAPRHVMSQFQLTATQELKPQYDDTLDSLTSKDRKQMRMLIEKHVSNTTVEASETK